MKVRVDIEEAEARLDTLLDLAVQGDEVVITRDGVAVARMIPISRP